MKRRSKPEIAVLRASVALIFLGGRTHSEISDACGIERGYVATIIAALRKGGMELPVRSFGSGPSADRDDILDAWADGMMARDIAQLTRRSLGSVKEIVRRARLHGDVRAISHKAVAA